MCNIFLTVTCKNQWLSLSQQRTAAPYTVFFSFFFEKTECRLIARRHKNTTKASKGRGVAMPDTGPTKITYQQTPTQVPGTNQTGHTFIQSLLHKFSYRHQLIAAPYVRVGDRSWGVGPLFCITLLCFLTLMGTHW